MTLAEVSPLIFATKLKAATSLAGQIQLRLQEGLRQRGEASLVLAGGSSFLPVYQMLANQEHQEALDWTKVSIFFGDERMVELTDERSNYQAAHQAWLHLYDATTGPRIYPMLSNAATPPQELCAQYLENLYDYGRGELPSFDVVLLGVGNDGHTASLFPKSIPGILGNNLVIAVTEAELPPLVPRITLTPATLNRAREVFFLITGAGKREILAKLRADQEQKYPANLIQPKGEVWLLTDEAAAV